MSDAMLCQFCGQPGDWCACGEPLRPLPFPDCAARHLNYCACRNQGYPRPDDTGSGCVLSRSDADQSGRVAAVIDAEIERTKAGGTELRAETVLVNGSRIELNPATGKATVRPPATTAYPDCAFPTDCACVRRGYPRPHRIGCLVPCINAEARELGWAEPYPAKGSDGANYRDALCGLEATLVQGMNAALAGDLLTAASAMRLAADYLAVMRTYEKSMVRK